MILNCTQKTKERFHIKYNGEFEDKIADEITKRIVDKEKATNTRVMKQVDLFSMDDEELFEDKKVNQENESKIQNVMLEIKKKYGKSSVIKAMNLEEGATTLKRNKLIGGHNADVENENE